MRIPHVFQSGGYVCDAGQSGEAQFSSDSPFQCVPCLGCHFLVFGLYRIDYVVSTGFGLYGVCGRCAEPPEIPKNDFETSLSLKYILKCLRQNALLSLVATCIKKPILPLGDGFFHPTGCFEYFGCTCI